ncbi:MAG: NUDIX domain-containing protein [Acidimicrobiia bacterium]
MGGRSASSTRMSWVNESRRHTVVMAAAILRRGSQILLCHRHPEGDHYPNVWDLPGGHVEDGESLNETLARELHEELGIRIHTPENEPWRVFREGNVELNVFLIDHWHGRPRNRARDEHDEIQWVDPNHVDSLELAHAIYELLLSEAASQPYPTGPVRYVTNTPERRGASIPSISAAVSSCSILAIAVRFMRRTAFVYLPDRGDMVGRYCVP